MVPSQKLQTYFPAFRKEQYSVPYCLTFINDLPAMIKSSSSKLFPDDSAVFKVIENDHDRQLLQKDLTALEKWEETWQMSFNPTKCTVIRIAQQSADLGKSRIINVLLLSNVVSIYLPIMSNPCWGPRHMRVKLQEY